MIAAGLGCRNGCSLVDVLAALDAALARAGFELDDVRALYTLDSKANEPALQQAAQRVSRILVALPRECLEAHAHAVRTPSLHVLSRFDLPSISETAALAGAFELMGRAGAPRLLSGRQVRGGATCALAAIGDAT